MAWAHPGRHGHSGRATRAPPDHRLGPADIGDTELQTALDRTWNVTVRDESGRLLGLARLLDDGALNATIWDMMVVPELRRKGIAAKMLDVLLERCQGRKIVALVATPSGRPLYERAGFTATSRGSVGMLLCPAGLHTQLPT